MASVTRFRQFSNKNWVLRADFRLQYPRDAGEEQSGKIPYK